MPRTENVENWFIFYCCFKTVLTDQARANNHKYEYTKKKTTKYTKRLKYIIKNISLSLNFLIFQSYGSSFMNYSIVKGFAYVKSTFGSKK